MVQRVRSDDIRLGQSLINQLQSLNINNRDVIIEKIFFMEDDEFCKLIGIPFIKNEIPSNQDKLF